MTDHDDRASGDFLTRLGPALAGGRATLQAFYDSLDQSDAAGRLIVAHYLADAQDSLEDEVRWDELALDLAPQVTDADLHALHPSLNIAGFVPSLQLNLADGYRRMQRFADASTALSASRAGNDRLPSESPEQQAYRQLILDGQQRVADLIDARDSVSTGLPDTR
ncbi:hypothetical protein BCF74_11775 [Knoellia remsis]|uniref:Uncharacterized protein n=1 Tax=Knoellia remsis TaxID=407159 RepID=A0A2T0UGJ5_9MICO|nr:hypothetical protein [Knoellia remsis]PRY57070.1 hypothetical protein BCF74_11775 [Knoellia remsis]